MKTEKREKDFSELDERFDLNVLAMSGGCKIDTEISRSTPFVDFNVGEKTIYSNL